MVRESTAHFESGGRRIPVECFEPEPAAPYPALLILHGREGLQAGGFVYRMLARELAGHGYAAFLVDYYARTGTRFTRDPEGDAERGREQWLAWMGTVRDALRWAGERPGIDPERLGLVGVSLGAYVALSVAACDPRVKAVVELFGGIPEYFADRLTSLPPVLILHGEHDTTVPVAEARRLERLLQEKGTPHECHIYPGQGHGFTGPILLDARTRTLAFLRRHLDG